MQQAWIYLLLAGVLEVVWASGLKYSENFSKLIPSCITIIAAMLSVYFLNLSLKTLPLGTAYAIWTGIGTIGTVIFGIIVFGEPISILKTICFILIITGMIGLKILN